MSGQGVVCFEENKFLQKKFKVNAGFLLTDVDGGLPPQQQLQTLAVVGQAAVVQRRAAFYRLLVQVQTARGSQTSRQKERRLQDLRLQMWCLQGVRTSAEIAWFTQRGNALHLDSY